MCKYVGDATDAAMMYCDRLAHFPLGRNRENRVSPYSSGKYIARREYSVKESRQAVSVHKEMNVHPKDIWQLSRLVENPYEKVKFYPNFEVMDGKYPGTTTLARAGINTALLMPKQIGPVKCESATVWYR